MLLAYPTATPGRVTRLISAICAEQIAATIEQFPARRYELLEKYPNYDPQNRVEFSTLIPRLEDAYLVGEVILQLIQETATGQTPRLPTSMSQPSVDQLIRYLLPRGESEPEEPYFGNYILDKAAEDSHKWMDRPALYFPFFFRAALRALG